MPDDKVLEILIRAKDQASKVMKRVGAAAKQAMKVAGVAVAAFAAFSVAKFVEFEGQMNEVFTLMPDISEQAMDDMTDQVKDFSKEFGTLPNEVVPALYSAISAGVPKENVFDFLEVAQKAAVGGVTDLETAVDGISSVVNAYGEDVIDASKASDLMFTAVKLGKTDFKQLSASLFNVVPAAVASGVAFEDVTSSIAVLTAQGTPTTVATTQMRAMFNELSKASSQTAKTFKEISGKTFKEFIAAGGDTQSALALLSDHAEDTGVQMEDLFSSVEAAAAAGVLAGSGADAFGSALEEMGSSAGATEAAYDRMEEGMGRSFDKIKAALVVTAIEFGEKLAPVVAAFAEWLIANMPKIQAAVGSAFNFLSKTVIPALRLAIQGLITIVQRMIQVWNDYAPVIKIIGGLILTVMIPIWIQMGVRATITAAKVAASWVVQNVAAVGATVVHSAQIGIQVAKWLFLGVQSLIHAVKVVASWVMTGVSAVAQTVIMVAQAAIFVARWAFMGAQSLIHAATVAAAWLIAMGPIAIVIAAVVALVALIILNWDKIREVTAALWESITATASEAWAALTNMLSSAWESIKDAGAAAFQWLSDTINGIFAGISSFVRGYVNTIILVINTLISGFNSVINLASKIPIIGDKISGFSIPKIPQLAMGAIVTAPTLAIVGDNKREPEAVLPLSKLDSMLKNSGGGGPVFQRGAFEGAVFQVMPQTGSAADFIDSMQSVELEVNGRKGLE